MVPSTATTTWKISSSQPSRALPGRLRKVLGSAGYLHGSSSKILQRNRTYWSLLNPSASFTPLLTCSSSPTWHFPPSPSPPLGGMSLRLASPPWPRTRDVVPLPRKLPSLAPHPWCCWWWYESQLMLCLNWKLRFVHVNSNHDLFLYRWGPWNYISTRPHYNCWW